MVRKRKRLKVGRFQKKLAIVKGRLAFLHAMRDTVIRNKTRTKAVRRTLKGQTFGKRHGEKLEGISEIRNQDSKERLCLRKERTTGNCIRGWRRRQEP
jgi:hypothetical protein